MSSENGDASQDPHPVRSARHTRRTPCHQPSGVREASCFPLTGAFKMGDPLLSGRITTVTVLRCAMSVYPRVR
jgi:hypothetical protein